MPLVLGCILVVLGCILVLAGCILVLAGCILVLADYVEAHNLAASSGFVMMTD